MKKVIKSDTLWPDTSEIPYSDKDLRECIRLLAEQVANIIEAHNKKGRVIYA